VNGWYHGIDTCGDTCGLAWSGNGPTLGQLREETTATFNGVLMAVRPHGYGRVLPAGPKQQRRRACRRGWSGRSGACA
jgi:hypothetical protein